MRCTNSLTPTLDRQSSLLKTLELEYANGLTAILRHDDQRDVLGWALANASGTCSGNEVESTDQPGTP
jgi:hypothetical protein